MENGFTNLRSAALFGIDLIEHYNKTDDEWYKNNALLSLLGIEEVNNHLKRTPSFSKNSRGVK